MQESRNNCFGLKKSNLTLRHSKVGKHECSKVESTYVVLFFIDCQLIQPLGMIYCEISGNAHSAHRNKLITYHCCYFPTLVFTYFCLMKGVVTFFRSETIVSNFLCLMLLIFKVSINHFPKCQFEALLVALVAITRFKKIVQEEINSRK